MTFSALISSLVGSRVCKIVLRRLKNARSAMRAGESEHVCLRYADLWREGANRIGEGTKISGKVSMGYASTIGRYSNLVGGTIEIGRYCQFGPCVAIYGANHPITHLTSYVGNALFEGRLKRNQQRTAVRIGNDVWIGHGAILLPGVTVGDGAIIGAGTVITRDVEEFSVVAGNPGRPIGKRFPDEVIELIRRMKWWDLTPTELLEVEDIFHIDFRTDFEAGVNRIREYLKTRVPVGIGLPNSGNHIGISSARGTGEPAETFARGDGTIIDRRARGY